MTNPVIENVRRSLGRTAQISSPQGAPLTPRPAIYDSRLPESSDVEMERFLEVVKHLSGVPQKLSPAEIDGAMKTIVEKQNIRKVAAWETPYLRQLVVTEIL